MCNLENDTSTLPKFRELYPKILAMTFYNDSEVPIIEDIKKKDKVEPQMVEIQNGNIYKCDQCDKRFEGKNAEVCLELHLEMHKINSTSEKQKVTKIIDIDQDKPPKEEKQVKIHVCQDCSSTFKVISKLRKHMMELHNKILKFSCTKCDKDYISRSQLLDHIATKHSGVKHLCNNCDKSFQSKTALNLHSKTIHDGPKKFECKRCRNKFNQKGTLIRHMKVCKSVQEVFDSPSAEGNVNKQEFGNSTSLSNDKIKNSISEEQEDKAIPQMDNAGVIEKPKKVPSYRCQECSTYFSVRSKLCKHMKEVHGKILKHSCCECHKSYSHRSDLLDHIALIHRGGKTLCCKTCGKYFLSRKALRLHTKTIHAGPKKFECVICADRFYQKGNLKLHMSRHHNQKDSEIIVFEVNSSIESKETLLMNSQSGTENVINPSQVQKIEFQTMGKDEVTNNATNIFPQEISSTESHITSKGKTSKQNEETSYECQECNTTFKSKSNLRSHMKEVHNETLPYTCKECTKIYTRPDTLKEHIASKHRGEKKLCKECGKSLFNRKSLELHIATIHKGIRRFGCNFCNRTFGQKVHLKLHMSRQHSQEDFNISCKEKNQDQSSKMSHNKNVFKNEVL